MEILIYSTILIHICNENHFRMKFNPRAKECIHNSSYLTKDDIEVKYKEEDIIHKLRKPFKKQRLNSSVNEYTSVLSWSTDLIRPCNKHLRLRADLKSCPVMLAFGLASSFLGCHFRRGIGSKFPFYLKSHWRVCPPDLMRQGQVRNFIQYWLCWTSGRGKCEERVGRFMYSRV